MIKSKNYKKLSCQISVPQILDNQLLKYNIKNYSYIIEINIFGVHTLIFQTKAGFKEFIRLYNMEHDHILFVRDHGEELDYKCRYNLDEIEIDPSAQYSYKLFK
jgi:hypothetical protein